MNVAFVLGYISERYGGPPLVALSLGSAMRQEGVGVSYWATGDDTDRQALASHGPSLHLYPPVWPRRWFRSPELVRGLAARASDLDVLHLLGLWVHPTMAASKFARKAGIPYVLQPVGALEPWRLRQKLLKKRLYLALVAKKMMEGSACLRASSPAEVESVRRTDYKGPITIVPSGIDPAAFSNLPEPLEAEEHWPGLEGRRTVLFLSRLAPEKGLDQLIPAWAELTAADGYSDAVLVIAGPDNKGYGARVRADVERHGVSSKVLVVGMVRGRRKLALYRRADVFILPSHAENFGIVVPEALACGTPVIATTGTPWKEVEDVGAGRWIEPEQGAIRQALRELLDMSEEDRRKMGQRGRRHVLANYTWETAARKLITVYDCILNGREVPLHPGPAPGRGPSRPASPESCKGL